MSLRKIASLGLLICVGAAGMAHADDQDRRRGSRGGRDGRGRDARVVQPRVVVRPPVVVQRRAVPRGPYDRGYRSRANSYRRGWYGPVIRPRLGIGIYIGAPYRYSRPYYGRPYYSRPYYAYPPAYGYAGGAIHVVPPPHALYGGVRLDVTPRDAEVYVDGYYAGIVDDFDGTFQRVALEPGPHRFEIVAPGFEPLSFEVNVRPDQTVRFRGDLARIVP